MAKALRTLDVWIVESNTAYRDVPFTIVIDWMQQGRLLPTDKVRPARTEEWFELGKFSLLAPYLPRQEEHRAGDVAEALEPVSGEMTWKARGDDDDDVDMIPLIDVSLVLLIFFMMTSTVTMASTLIPTPEVKNAVLVSNDPFWIGVEWGKDKVPLFSLGQGAGAVKPDDRRLTMDALLQRLDDRLKAAGSVEAVTIRGQKDLPMGIIKALRTKLDSRRLRGQFKQLRDEVTEAQAP